MRHVFRLALTVVLAFSPVAHATSFANRGLGLGLGYMRIFTDDATVPNWALPLWLEGSYYAENGIDVYIRVPIALAYVAVGAPPQGGPGFVFALGGQVGVRYLFLEESIRPFAGIHLSGIGVFLPSQSGITLGTNLLAGPGVNGGVEFFVSDSISIQARGYFDWFIGVNCGQSNCQRFNVGGTATATTYF